MKIKANFIRFFCIALFVALIVSQLNLSMGEVNQQNLSEDQAKWLSLATNAWKFFQAGVGVNVNTGLHAAGLNWPYFTSWDLGTYVQAIIDAKELGILQDGGQWGFNSRVDKILGFLKTRQLTGDGLPYLVYDSRTGEPSGSLPTFFVDEGKLIMALYDLKTLRPDYAQDIDYVVKDRSNNTALIPVPDLYLNSTDLYVYYAALAFKAFEFPGWDLVPSSIIGTIASRPSVTTFDVELPMAHVSCEPLLLTKFEANPQDPRFDWLLSQVYQASEARFNATGHYTAFSEGNTGLLNPSYVYEFVVDNNGSTWELSSPITPIAYFKVAVGFNAIFNTEYTKIMVNYMSGKFWSAFGFQEGVAEDGRVVDDLIDRTNGLVISSARYAIENAPTPIPTPSPTPTETPTPSPSFSPSPTPSASPSSSLSISPTISPSISPSPSPSPSTSPIPSPSPISTTTPPVGWTIEPSMLWLFGFVFAAGWLALFIPLIILFRRNRSSPKSENK